MAGALNIVVLGFQGITSLPSLISAFAAPQEDKILINIGVGATNSISPNGNPGGNCPTVNLYDINGNAMGFAACHDCIITDGGTEQLTIGGDEGSTTSESPDYIQLMANGDDAVCIAWFSTTSSQSDGGDLNTWNGATAKACGLPWYPSTAKFPGISPSYSPPCFWISSDGRFVDGFSARLSDFSFPSSSGQANASATQWSEFPETLCNAPARQQFYNTTIDSCIPFYPSGLESVIEKDPDTGFDVDFNAIQSSYNLTCTSAGAPFNVEANLGQFESYVYVEPTSTLTIPSSLTLESSLNLGPLRRATDITVPAGVLEVTLQSSLDLGTLTLSGPQDPRPTKPPTITTSPQLPSPSVAKRKEPILKRRVEQRKEQPSAWCDENQLVISPHTTHSAIEVCESDSSWGPDFVSLAEGIFCDMCERKVYPLCSGGGNLTTATVSSSQAAVTAMSFNASQAFKGVGACFDLETTQLRTPAGRRRDNSIPLKTYLGVKHWKQ